MKKDSYSFIIGNLREICIVKSLKEGMLAGHICRILSPYCSAFFIRRNITPNSVTIFMILLGIFGSVLFMIPNIWCKIAGYLLWFMWFTMDLSDGEVARYTKNFSKYGTEMDYMAHLIDHPLMNIALWLTFLSFDIISPCILSLVFILSISIELFTRNIIAFQHYIDTDKYLQVRHVSCAKYFLTQILLYPNLIIVFTPLIVVDYYCKIGFSLYLYLTWFSFSLIVYIRSIIKQLLYFYRG